MPWCSIIWKHPEHEAQVFDNVIRFVFDYLTLFLILFVGGYIVVRRPNNMISVKIQLILLLAAQILYCIRSSARIYEGDKTYFGRKLPTWTYTCM